jgi:hypothetical protein
VFHYDRRLTIQSRIRKSKKKQRNTFADLDQEDNDNEDNKPAGIEETRANLDDEWPEEDVKPKKGKKGKKAKQVVEVDEDEDEEKPETRANIDDEWPEEDVKPKKGKKGKKAKAQTVDDEEEEEEEKEVKAEEVAEVKAVPVKQEKAEVKEVEEKDDDDDEGPRVSWLSCHMASAYHVDPHQEGEGEAKEGERKGASDQGGLADLVGEEESTSCSQACRCWRLCSSPFRPRDRCSCSTPACTRGR